MKRYSLSECYTLLDVDPKTFRGWLAKSGITTEISKADPRVKYLTEEQAQQLAYMHGRTLLETNSKQNRPLPPGAYKLLADQVNSIEQRLYELDEHSKDIEQLTQLLRQLTNVLDIRINSLEAMMEQLVPNKEGAKIIDPGKADGQVANPPRKTKTSKTTEI